MRQSTKTTFITGLPVLFCRAALPSSSKTPQLHGQDRPPPPGLDRGPLWRKLSPGQQALLVLAYLRKGETFA